MENINCSQNLNNNHNNKILDIVLNCPHCNEPILIEQINCGIFRHGIYRENLKQMNPHENKIKCDSDFQNELIYGCGKPFQIKIENDHYSISICDYI